MLGVWIATGLLVYLLAGEVWALPATISYAAYLVAVGGVALWQRVPGWAVGVLWGLAAPILIVAAYTPSGWAVWSRALLLLALVLITHRHRPTGRAANAVAAAAALALTVFSTYAIDRGIGLATGGRQPGGLVFPRGSVVRYETHEFAHSVYINRYGFRGAAADLNRRTDCRVMLLGDSFTYGWGVSYDETWGALLEAELTDGQRTAQVLNLGVPGGNVADYAAIATTAAPLIAPDVVIVGVLQGDDMRGASRPASGFPRSLTFGEQAVSAPLTDYMTFHYPFIAERTALRRVGAARIHTTWAATAAAFLAGHTPTERARYDALPAVVQADFETGWVSPHFIELAVTAPDYWNWPTQPRETLTPYIDVLAGNLRDIAAAAPGAQVLVASVPYGAYTQPGAHADLRRLGFDVPLATLTNELVDDAIADAAHAAGLPYITATDAFRASQTNAFYPVDGHFNAAGNRLFAAVMAGRVADACDRHQDD